MTKKDLEKRVAELEAQVATLEAQLSLALSRSIIHIEPTPMPPRVLPSPMWPAYDPLHPTVICSSKDNLAVC